MKKLGLCLMAFFVCTLMGCRMEETMGRTSEDSGILILWDEKEETFEWVERIHEKIDVVSIGISRDEELLEENIEKAEVVIAGAYGAENDIIKLMERIIALDGMDEKRLSSFLVVEKESDLDEWEYKVKSETNEAMLLPGILLREDCENIEEELNRINGWLTTIFTWKK